MPVWQGSDAELLAELGALETRLHSTWAQILSVIAEIDSRGTAATVGYGTTVELVRTVARVSRGEGAGQGLRRRRRAPCPRTEWRAGGAKVTGHRDSGS